MISSLVWSFVLLLLLLICQPEASTSDSGTRSHKHLRPVGLREDSDTTKPSKIVNGQNAYPGQFPWFVVFPNSPSCGGTLIAPDRVLTSATCVLSNPPATVRVGALTTTDGTNAAVQCSKVHPDYYRTPESIYNDIAILELATPIISLNLAPINMNRDFPPMEQRPLTILGLGLLGPSGPNSASTLQTATVDLIPLDTCSDSFPDGVILDRFHICSETLDVGFCTGDGGGPLMDQETGIQVGIASFTYGSCGSDFPDVYTNIGSYSGWIREQLDGTICPAENPSPPSDGDEDDGFFLFRWYNSLRQVVGGIF